MRRRELLELGVCIPFAPALTASPRAKPNVLLFSAAAWRGQARPNTDRSLHAPTLERLMDQGVVFNRHYVCCPEDEPSRNARMTGCFPTSERKRPNLPDVLRQAGYGIAQTDDIQFQKAIEFLKANSRNPFFLEHRSGNLPLGNRGPLPETIVLEPNVPADYRQKAQWEISATYAGYSVTDMQLAKLLETLENLSLSSNTIVVFTSDHGDMLGSQRLEGHGVPFEEAVRVPLVIRYPGRRPESSDILTSNVDLMPTLLHLCGAESPEGVQGRDLSFVLLDGKAERPQSVYAFARLGTAEEWRAVVRGLDKIVFDKDLGVTQLYNIGQDPYEMDNLARDPSQELKRNELTAILKDWMRRAADRMDPSGLKKRK